MRRLQRVQLKLLSRTAGEGDQAHRAWWVRVPFSKQATIVFKG